MDKPEDVVRLDTITVTADVKEELRASMADLYVNIVGSSFFTGSMALKKTKEVNELVAALAAAGVGEGDVYLESIRAAAASGGVLRKNSSARYRLRVRCATLEVVGEAIGAITAQKNAELDPIVWRYPNAEGVGDRLLDAATRLAHERAKRIAAHLGISLTGVRNFDAKMSDPERAFDPFAHVSRGHTLDKTMDRSAGTLDMVVSHVKEVRLRVEVDYYVAGYNGNVAPPPPPAA